MESSIQLLIVDDSEPFRVGLRALIKATPDMALAGEAENGRDAIAFAERLQPDVILMDLHMPDVNGIEATRQIVQTSPHIAILVLTMVDDDDSLFAAMQAGARGYLLKGAAKSEVLRAIRDVAAGAAAGGDLDVFEGDEGFEGEGVGDGGVVGADDADVAVGDDGERLELGGEVAVDADGEVAVAGAEAFAVVGGVGDDAEVEAGRGVGDGLVEGGAEDGEHVVGHAEGEGAAHLAGVEAGGLFEDLAGELVVEGSGIDEFRDAGDSVGRNSQLGELDAAVLGRPGQFTHPPLPRRSLISTGRHGRLDEVQRTCVDDRIHVEVGDAPLLLQPCPPGSGEFGQGGP